MSNSEICFSVSPSLEQSIRSMPPPSSARCLIWHWRRRPFFFLCFILHRLIHWSSLFHTVPLHALKYISQLFNRRKRGLNLVTSWSKEYILITKCRAKIIKTRVNWARVINKSWNTSNAHYLKRVWLATKCLLIFQSRSPRQVKLDFAEVLESSSYRPLWVCGLVRFAVADTKGFAARTRFTRRACLLLCKGECGSCIDLLDKRVFMTSFVGRCPIKSSWKCSCKRPWVIWFNARRSRAYGNFRMCPIMMTRTIISRFELFNLVRNPKGEATLRCSKEIWGEIHK